jgi:hypothetical protein
MSNGKWQIEKQRGFAIRHLRFAIQDAFFSILLEPARPVARGVACAIPADGCC